jgi:GNAT superfamily N-acetyltransferase
MASFSIRPATPRDAAAAVDVLRESITELCALDHANDPAKLGPWLQNKTPEHFLRWLDEPDGWIIVAERDAQLCGVAMIHASHHVRLCYVRPGYERAGIGSALLHALEAYAAEHGANRVKLTSSATARAFYERHGYRPSDESVPAFAGMPVYPYVKALEAAEGPLATPWHVAASWPESTPGKKPR